MENGQLSAAASAITAEAKLAGLWLEKRENLNTIVPNQLADALAYGIDLRARHTKSAMRAARDWRTDGRIKRPNPAYSSILISSRSPSSWMSSSTAAQLPS